MIVRIVFLVLLSNISIMHGIPLGPGGWLPLPYIIKLQKKKNIYREDIELKEVRKIKKTN